MSESGTGGSWQAGEDADMRLPTWDQQIPLLFSRTSYFGELLSLHHLDRLTKCWLASFCIIPLKSPGVHLNLKLHILAAWCNVDGNHLKAFPYATTTPHLWSRCTVKM